MITKLAFFWCVFIPPDIGKSMKLLENGVGNHTAFRNLVLLHFDKCNI